MRVYFQNHNPAIDHFAFKNSNARCAELVANGEARFIQLPDGRTAIQLFRCQAARDNSWRDRAEADSTTSQYAGMPYIKTRWPESVLRLRAESLIPNVRAMAACV